jgi:hypothetical protein
MTYEGNTGRWWSQSEGMKLEGRRGKVGFVGSRATDATCRGREGWGLTSSLCCFLLSHSFWKEGVEIGPWER